MLRKITIEIVRNKFLEEGYELLESEYKNAKTKMKYKCPEGHIHEISWDNFNRGHRCPECKDSKLNIGYIRKEFEKEGYLLLTTNYINNRQKLEYVCSNGHKHETTWVCFYQGIRCPSCNKQTKKENTEKDIVNLFEKEGYSIIEKKYEDKVIRIKYKCPKGHIHVTTWRNFKSGCRCPYCDGQKIEFEEIQKLFIQRGYILLTKKEEYKNARIKIKYICPSGHYGEMTWCHFKEGTNCPKCNKIYKGEERIENYLKEKEIEYKTQHIFKDCKNVRPLKFDFYLPKYNICIEYDGEGHYQVIEHFGGEKRFKEGQKCDQLKTQYCKDNNINLLRIPYWEFNNIENIICQEIEKLKTFND